MGLARKIVEIIAETVGRETVAVNLAVHQIILAPLAFAVLCAALFFDAGNAVPESIMIAKIPPKQKRRHAFQKIYQQGVVTPSETEIVIESDELLERPLR